MIELAVLPLASACSLAGQEIHLSECRELLRVRPIGEAKLIEEPLRRGAVNRSEVPQLGSFRSRLDRVHRGRSDDRESGLFLAELQESVGGELVGRVLFAAEDWHLQQMEQRRVGLGRRRQV